MTCHPVQPTVLPELNVTSVKDHLVSGQQLEKGIRRGLCHNEVPRGMHMTLECPHVAEEGSLPRPKILHGQS